MTCFYPATGWRIRDTKSDYSFYTRKYSDYLAFSKKPWCIVQEEKGKCGQCSGCRVENTRQWAMRCVAEMADSIKAAFITLTFDPLYYPRNGSVSKDFIKKWFKDFRERVRYHYDTTIRFYCCGEYGSKGGRAHYHAIIFGFEFPDKKLWSKKNGQLLYVSKFLEKAWFYGWHTIGQVTFDSCQYVAQYVMKKIVSKDSRKIEEHYEGREPEFHHMSRMPGIGKKYYEMWRDDMYPKDAFTFKGRQMRPPAYFDYLLKRDLPDLYEQVKEARQQKYFESDWAKLSDSELEKELRRKEKFLHNAFKRHHRYLEEEATNA